MMKKGFVSSQTAIIILSLVMLLVIFLFLGQVEKGGTQVLTKQLCKESVNAQSFSKLKVANFGLVDTFGRPSTLKCATNYVEVPSGREKRVLADEMVDCWDMYGRGKKEIFDTSTGNYCAICSRLEFSRDTTLDGFTDYLLDQKLPTTKENYLQFISGTTMTEEGLRKAYEQSEFKKVDQLSTSEPLYVMYIMGKAVEDSGVEGASIGAVSGGVIGALGVVLSPFTAGTSGIVAAALLGVGAGATTGYFIGSSHTEVYWDSSLLVVPVESIEQIQSQCHVLEGNARPLKIA